MSSTLASLLFLCLAVAYSHSAAHPDVATKIKEIFSKCAAENNINNSELSKQWKSGNISDTKDVKCYLQCTMKSMKILEDGKFSLERLGRVADHKWAGDAENIEKAKKIHVKCVKDVTDNPNTSECGPSFDLVVCMAAESKKLGLKKVDW